MAEARGIELSIGELSDKERVATVDVSLGGGVREIGVVAMAPPGGAARVTRIGAFHVDVTPRQTMIVLTNNDVPGVIGRVGTALGDAHVNIAEYHQARLAQGGEALAAISVDGVCLTRTARAPDGTSRRAHRDDRSIRRWLRRTCHRMSHQLGQHRCRRAAELQP